MSVDIEKIFIQKFTEKYALNERDLKRAFAKFDSKKTGLLEIADIEKLFKLLLNGFSQKDIAHFVSTYDLNGDGAISYNELLACLTGSLENSSGSSRDILNGSRRSSSLNSLHNATSSYSRQHADVPSLRLQSAENLEEDQKYSYDDNANDDDDVAFTEADAPDLTLASEVQSYLRIWKNYLKKLCADRAGTINGAKTGTHPKGPAAMTLSANQLSATQVAELLTKEFQLYTGQGEGRTRANCVGVSYADFCKVMRKLRVPGSAVLTPALLHALFYLCQASTGTGNTTAVAGRGSADPSALITLLYPPATRDRLNLVAHAATQSLSQSRSPTHSFVQSRTVSNDALIHRDRLGIGLGVADPISLPFVRTKSRTALAPPAHMSEESIKRSGQLPPYRCVREHVYGLSAVSTGSGVMSLPLPPAAYSGRGPSVANRDNSTDCSIVYVAGPVGIVHRLGSAPSNCDNGDIQKFYEGHTDDVTCIDVTVNGAYAATGCVRSTGDKDSAVIHVWRTSQPDGSGLVVGKGFFERAVAAVKFSSDSMYLCAAGCDDNHRLGVWSLTLPSSPTAPLSSVSSSTLLAEFPCLHGLPSDLKWMSVAPGPPSPGNGSTVCRDHGQDACFLFSTAGDRHLRVWSFSPRIARAAYGSASNVLCGLGPTGVSVGSGPPAGPPALTYKACTITTAKGSSKVTATPRVYTCSVYVPRGDGQGGSVCDLVAGGSNGAVYLWRRGGTEFVSAAKAIPAGGVCCLAVHGDLLCCGGAGGVVRILDVRTLAVITGYSVLSLGLYPANKTGSAGASSGSLFARPRSASTTPSSRLSTARSSSTSRLSTASRPSTAQSTSYSSVANRSSVSNLRSSRLGYRPSSLAIRSAPAGLPPPAGAPTQPAQSTSPAYGGEEDPNQQITGLTVVAVPPISGMSQNASLLGLFLVVVTSAGRAVRIDLGKTLGDRTPPAPAQLLTAPLTTLFHYHVGTVTGLCAENTSTGNTNNSQSISGGSLVVTAGEDRRVCVWDVTARRLVTRLITKTSVVSVAFDQSSRFIAVGLSSGGVCVLALVEMPAKPSVGTADNDVRKNGSGGTNERLFGSRQTLDTIVTEFTHILMERGFRRDAQSTVSDVKFSPDNTKLAAGSHDNHVYVYAVSIDSQQDRAGACTLRPLHRLSGHSAYVTHIDWSVDSQLLQSTCGAYELLVWSADNGRQYTVMPSADIDWATRHCVLGYTLAGIWPPGSDGTDIDALDADPGLGLLVTGDDDGRINLFSYPCVVRHAPRVQYSAHASHVTNIRLFSRASRDRYSSGTGADLHVVVSVGGRDATMAVWRLLPIRSQRSVDEYGDLLGNS